MKKYLVLIVAALLLLSAGNVFADGEWTLWVDEAISGKINDSVSANFTAAQKWTDDMSELSYWHTDLGFTFKTRFEKLLSIGLNYRQVYTLGSDGDWAQEKRPHFSLYTTLPAYQGFTLKNRFRMEYRDTVSYNDWRLREMVTIVLPYEFTQAKIKPYIANEIFYDFNASSLNMNRLYVGASIGKIYNNIKAKVEYFWEAKKKSNNWNDGHVLHLVFTIAC